jgi:hypothetical protein
MNLHESARDRGRGAVGHNVTFQMTRSLDPFRFVLIAVSGWMNQQQLPSGHLDTTVEHFSAWLAGNLQKGRQLANSC